MKNRKKEISALATGLLVGSLLTGPAAQAAQTLLTASPSTQKFYADGQRVQLEAYNINGYNYIKLGDLSSLVGFELAYDAQTNSVYIGERPVADPVNNGTVTLPANGSRYVPKTGDVIRCDDGSNYAITDVKRWETNISPLPDLPTATCDWTLFPNLELPQVEARHFTNKSGEVLFVRNLYETRRMQYTIYNALGKEPSAWKDGKPLATVQLAIPADLEPYTASMWPWHGSELEDLVHSRPNSQYYIEAWDYYLNGVFQYTRHSVVSL